MRNCLGNLLITLVLFFLISPPNADFSSGEHELRKKEKELNSFQKSLVCPGLILPWVRSVYYMDHRVTSSKNSLYFLGFGILSFSHNEI